VSVEVDRGVLNAAVPSFALQHLVENAVRHGIARRSDPGQVMVSAHRDGEILVLTVEDDGPGMDEHAATPPGHGIENTRERLRALYGGHASLTFARRAAGGTIATLRIPFRELTLGSDV
jgi:LytS/YehU family sensor histidine kinase